MNVDKQRTEKISPKRQKPEKQPKPVNLEDDLQRVVASPQTAEPSDILRLQSKAGNTIVCRLLDEDLVQRIPAAGNSGILNEHISNEIQHARGSGIPLAPSLRQGMEKEFNNDFSNVRIHTDHRADNLSKKINARAFTTGSDIFFRRDAYSPGTSKGERTLRHELTHVVQQGGGTPAGRLKLGAPDTAEEHQAERAASTHRSQYNPSSNATGVIQRTINYSTIATKFGGTVKEEMVSNWVKAVPQDKETAVTGILMEGASVLTNEFQLLLLRRNGVNVEQMKQDAGGGPKQPEQQGPTQTQPPVQQEDTTKTTPPVKPPKPKTPPPVPPKPKTLLGSNRSTQPQQPQNQAPTQSPPQIQAPQQTQTQPGLTDADVRAYVVKKGQEKHMPSGPLLDILKDMAQGDLTKLTTQQIDDAIQDLENRDFDALARKNVSINKIVAFTSRFESKGVGDVKVPDQRNAILKLLAGGPGGHGAIGNTADFLQNSVIMSGVSGIGGLLTAPSLMEFVSGRDIGDQHEANMGLAGGIMMNSVQALQSTGQLMQSGLDWAQLHKARSYHQSVSGGGKRQSGFQATENMLQGMLGLTQAGLGFGATGHTFAGEKDNPDDPHNQTASGLNLTKTIFSSVSSGISVGTGITKAGVAKSRGSTIKSIPYKDSPYLTQSGNDAQKSVFPKLKSVLVDTQSKKAKGTGMDIGGNIAKLMGNVTKAGGFAGGETARTVTSLVSTGVNIGVPIIKGIVDKIKDYRRGKKIEKAGFRSNEEFRLERLRELDTMDDKGKSTGEKSVFNVREVRDGVAKVYDEYETWSQRVGNQSESAQMNEKSTLSVSKLLSATGSFGDMDALLRAKDDNNRKKFIQNIILARQATY